MDKIKFVGIAGSLRKASINKALIGAVKGLAPAEVSFEILEMGNLPLFDQDVEMANYPKEAQALKDKIVAAQGAIIATPEYNRSIPGVLKNFLDWTSRPYGHNAWAGKVVGVTGASGGAIGTALAQYHLKNILLYLNARVLGQPELYVNNAGQKISEQGVLTDVATKEHIAKFWEALLAEVRRGV
ncbi:MAG TPA: NAD(P)H-dependent oxidoreductase [Candidatus Paceibacterota bacterium]|jgi:chromate reductase|nr:NAD(P)H-dependent oxidoreductase [Candidatus Paceibacterota bacterium]